MSIMVCNDCSVVYGPTVFVCPNCQSTNVSVAQFKLDEHAHPQLIKPPKTEEDT